MPRIHTVQKSQKETKCTKCGAIIPVGSKYFYYSPYRSKKKSRCENCYPKPSELTSSEYLQTVYGWGESNVADLIGENLEEAITDGQLETFIEEIRALGEEQNERRENMPESLQYSPTGELLEERADACESASSDLDEFIDIEIVGYVENEDYIPEDSEDYDEDDEDNVKGHWVLDNDEYDSEEDFNDACEEKYQEICNAVDEALSNLAI